MSLLVKSHTKALFIVEFAHYTVDNANNLSLYTDIISS
jgi:hypothetical protein